MKLPKNTATDHVDLQLKILSKLYNNKVPYGSLKTIGDFFGVSREFVRQRAKELGLVSARETLKLNRTATCVYCGRKYVQKVKRKGRKYCSRKCCDKYRLYKYWEIVQCRYCGLYYKRYKRGVITNHHSNKYFCSKKCQGHWIYKKNLYKRI